MENTYNKYDKPFSELKEITDKITELQHQKDTLERKIRNDFNLTYGGFIYEYSQWITKKNINSGK